MNPRNGNAADMQLGRGTDIVKPHGSLKLPWGFFVAQLNFNG